ncbi:MAG: NAD-dependent epimerase/dehydratase family protein [Chloroflexi bacterium]|nr:NAD-dependent epimerase/dehydratase family protein [Chloroflexota bacterium]
MDLKHARVLITGANGFIGGRLAERLADECNVRVRAMVRSEIRNPKFEIVLGDITDPATLADAVRDCDAVVHCAAMQGKGRLADFRRVNVDGTLNLVRAAKDAGVKRFIHISTINVHGFPPPRDCHANSPLAFTGDFYSISKAEAERAAWQFSRNYQLPITVIRPGCTYGPRSNAWTLVPLARVRRGAPVLIGNGDGICNAIYIDNLIDLILLALQNDAAIGQAFIGTEGRGVTWREFYGAYARIAGVSRLNGLPRVVAIGLANASEIFARFTGGAPLISRASVEFYSHRVVYDISKATRLLGYAPRVSFDEGIKRTEEWLKTENEKL